MFTKKMLLVPLSLLVLVVLLNIPRAASLADASQGNHFIIAQGTMISANQVDKSFPVTIRMDSQNGRTWILRIRTETAGKAFVEWVSADEYGTVKPTP